MDWGLFILIAFASAILYGIIDALVVVPRRRLQKYGAAWKDYNEHAFQPQVSESLDGNVRRVVRVAVELVSTGGKRAIAIEHGGATGIVVHEFSRDGTFSSRGPYFIRQRGAVWRVSGARHLVETVRYPYGIPTSNPSGGTTREVGRRILEPNTQKHAPVSLKTFESMQREASRQSSA